MAKIIAFYARTSTLTQSTGLESQVRALEAYASAHGISNYLLYTDEVSGRKASRPGLDRLNAAVRAGEVSKVVVYSLSRFSRSVKHLIENLDLLERNGVGFVSLTETLDTTTPTGKAVITILSAISQLEADLIRERVKNGLVNARAKGIRLGRPKQVTNIELIEQLASQGLSHTEIGRLVGCSQTSVSRELRRLKAKLVAPSDLALRP